MTEICALVGSSPYTPVRPGAILDVELARREYEARVRNGEIDVPFPAAIKAAAAAELDDHGRWHRYRLLDAGDHIQGTLESDVSEGASIIAFYNFLGIDVATIGNHDFDEGYENLWKLIEESDMPVLSANLVWADSGEPVQYVKPYIIKNYDGIKVAIIGLTTTDTPKMAFPAHVEPVEFLDEIERGALDTVDQAAALLRRRGIAPTEAIARKAMAIAAQICVYTNDSLTVETLDATDTSAVEAFTTSTVERYGAVDGIVNCVGSILLKAAHLTSDEEWRQTLAANLDSAFAAVRDLAAHSGGHIIGIPRDNLPVLDKQDGSGPLWEAGDAWEAVTAYRTYPGARRAILALGAPAFVAAEAAAALQEEIEAWQQRHPAVDVRLSIDGDVTQLGEAINISLYRLIQESLTNISKHAGATRVDIRLMLDEHDGHPQVVLEITDNGCGMQPAPGNRGLGLIGMRERVEALHGTLAIDSAPAQGVRIRLVIPVPTLQTA